MRAFHGSAILILTLACGKERPFADDPLPTDVAGEQGPNAVESPASETASPPGGDTPAPVGGEAVGTPSLDGVDSTNEGVLGATGEETAACIPGDAGACSADAGPGEPGPAPCVPAGPRDCTSALDNDCDGQPDNVLDDVCRCLPGSVEACGEHPGLDGRGPCRAGTRTCVASEGNASSDWSQCEGSVGPALADSCVPEDDGDCDGSANEGCDCVDGVTQPCGPPNDLGICQRGTQTCAGGRFGACVGATFPVQRDCRSNADNDCDGRPDNVLDNVCQCIIGTSQACGTHPQDGVGACRPGSQQCQAGANNSSSFFGQCNGSVGPAPQDACNAVNDANCDGQNNGGCECVSARGNADCSDDPNNSRCNGQGQCSPCQANSDCSLAAGGRNTCRAGQCVQDLTPPGEPCTQNGECESGRCDRWFQDLDGDRHGDASVSRSTCASDSGGLPPIGFVGNSDDCCDLGGGNAAVAAQIFTGQEELFFEAQTVCPTVADFDYNCSGNIEYKYQEDTEQFGACANVPPAQCDATRIWVGGENPGCGLTFASRIDICFFETVTGDCSVMGSLTPGGSQELNSCN